MERDPDFRSARDDILSLRDKAPIAGQFEDCIQAYEKLSSALKSCNLSVNNGKNEKQNYKARQQLKETLNFTEDGLTKLKIWDSDLNASSRELDHALRGCLQLRKMTVGHLIDLHDVLVRATELIPCQYWNLPSEQDQLPQSEDVSSSWYDQESDEDADKLVEEALDIISCLFHLLPNLQDPEDDWEVHELTENETASYKALVVTMFPKAPLYLRNRFVVSCSRRRQRLKLDQGNNRSGKSKAHALAVPKILHKTTGQKRSGNRRFRRRFDDASDAGASTAVSAWESVFSGGAVPSTLGNTSIDAFGELHIQMKPPKMPAELVRGRPCNCRFCGFQIPFFNPDEDAVKMTVERWEEHIFQDLQPYLCTFENCSQWHRSFALRSEWFHHESYNHRMQYLWRCSSGSCQDEFTTKNLFENHLLSVHARQVESINLDEITDLSKELALPASMEQICPLCGDPESDLQSLKAHLGSHMETFALVSMEYTSSEEDSDFEEEEAVEVDSHPLLDRFVSELGLAARDLQLSTQHKEVPQRYVSWDNIRAQNSTKPREPVSTDSSFEDLDNYGRTAKAIERQNRVESFLDKKASRDNESQGWSPSGRVWSNMPPRNSDFVGRKTDLEGIHGILAKPGQCCVLSGRGGVGKTASAIEYCYRYENYYRSIFWVEAENAGGCADKYALIAGKVGQIDSSKQSQSALISFVQEHLSKTEFRWLLVLDNVELLSAIDPYLPRNLSRTQGSVLVTTRGNDLPGKAGHKYSTLSLEELSVADSTHLLLKSLQSESQRSTEQFDPVTHPDYESAVEASKLVGRLPLAIGMIAGYVKVSQASLDMFLEIWEQQDEGDESAGSKDNDRKLDGIDASIDVLWNIGIGELMLKARNFLDLLSFLDPEAIQKDLFVGDHQELSLDIVNPKQKIKYQRMIDQLSGRKLIAVKTLEDDSEVYSIHRLLQQKIVVDMRAKEFAKNFQKVFILVRRQYPRASVLQIPEPEKWADCGKYMPHVFCLHNLYRTYRKHMRETIELAELFYDAGFHVWESETTAYDGLAFLESALQILDALGVERDIKLRADIHSIMGEFYSGMGAKFRMESVKQHAQVLEARQKVHNENPADKDNDVLFRNAANDLAFCFLNQNRFEKAELAFEDCYKQYQQWGTEDQKPFEYQKYYHNHGMVLAWRGAYKDALTSLHKAIELSAMHSTRTWHYCLNNFSLACVLLQSGDVQGALETHLATLRARADLYGKHEPTTVISTYAVGATYHQLGDPHSGMEYMLQCVESAKVVSGLPDEAYGRMLYHLSILEREIGSTEMAGKHEAEAVAILDTFMEDIWPCVKQEGDRLAMFDDLQALFDGRWTGTKLLKHMQVCATCKENGGNVSG